MSKDTFILHSRYAPSGDQPEAIARLITGINAGDSHQTLKGITGSGKTFTMANIIHRLQRPTLILAHNKTLAAQLYSEMKSFFPDNAVEYFVSYYDYYQPEIYLPGSDRFIKKDSAVNAHLERLRLSTTKSLIERKDVIVVASVSSIYGLGDPDAYRALQIPLSLGQQIDSAQLIKKLVQVLYQRVEKKLARATFRVRGDVLDIYPADSESHAIRIELFDDVIEKLYWIDAATGHKIEDVQHYLVSPKTLYSTPINKIKQACQKIEQELELQVTELNNNNRVTEAARLYERTMFDIEMMQQQGFCSGIENYSCYLNERDATLPPTTLLDYLPSNGLLFIDESHVMIPQISAMYRSDQSRKDTLIDYGFRLPSARNNRPLSFSEFEAMKPQTIFVSATPGEYENSHSESVVEQIIRPTGLLDPEIEIRSHDDYMENLLAEIKARVSLGERVLVTTLTKKSAESLHEFMGTKKIRARYLHSDIKTAERAAIINGLRAGDFDVLIGINLLREGLDIPEASLMAILDADHAGFLRSVSALIQIIGRVARNVNGKAILYADKMTDAMQNAIVESTSRRKRQIAYNLANGITPSSSTRKLITAEDEARHIVYQHTAVECNELSVLCRLITEKEHELLAAIDKGKEQEVTAIRIILDQLYKQYIYM